MIETIKVRKCDICGREMKNEHVTITWPDGHKEDVCHDCTRVLNMKLKEMRVENDNSFHVIGFRDVPWIPGKEAPFTFLGKFSSQKKAEVCKETHKADFDRIAVSKSLDEAIDMLFAEEEEEKDGIESR